MTETTTKTTTR